MPGIMQEKFQVDNAQNRNDDANGGWKSAQSARTKKGLPMGVEPHHGPINSAAINYESLPPGMDIEDQETTDLRVFKMTQGGQSDVSRDYNAGAVRKGYTRKDMKSTDDEYTNAHKDAFYDDMTVDGETGFAERNNMLDRM